MSAVWLRFMWLTNEMTVRAASHTGHMRPDRFVFPNFRLFHHAVSGDRETRPGG